MISKKIDEIIAKVGELKNNKALEGALSSLSRDFTAQKGSIKAEEFTAIIDKLSEFRQKWAALIEDKKEGRKELFAKRFMTLCFISFKEVLVAKFREMNPAQFFQILDRLPSLGINITLGSFAGNVANKLRGISVKQDLDAKTIIDLLKYSLPLSLKFPDLQKASLHKLLLNEDITLEDIDARILQIKAIKERPFWLLQLLENLEGLRTSKSAIVAALDASVTPPPVPQSSVELQDLLKRASESIGQFFAQSSCVPKACTAAFWVSFECNGAPYVVQFNAGMANGQSVVSQTIYPVSKPQVLYRGSVERDAVEFSMNL